MNALPDNLTDDDRLLLDLSGELPPRDAEGMAARLRSDAALALRRFAMAARLDAVEQSLIEIDAADPMPAAWPAARQFGDAVRSRVAAMPPVVRARSRWLAPWVIYPVAAAFLLAVGMGVWYFHVQDELDRTQVAIDDSPPVPILAMRTGAAVDPDKLTDEQIVGQFDSIVIDSDFRINRQIAALNFLQEALP